MWKPRKDQGLSGAEYAPTPDQSSYVHAASKPFVKFRSSKSSCGPLGARESNLTRFVL